MNVVGVEAAPHTMSSTGPAADTAGATHCATVSDSAVRSTADAPNMHCWPLWKPRPRRVTTVPPRMEPERGDDESMNTVGSVTGYTRSERDATAHVPRATVLFTGCRSRTAVVALRARSANGIEMERQALSAACVTVVAWVHCSPPSLDASTRMGASAWLGLMQLPDCAPKIRRKSNVPPSVASTVRSCNVRSPSPLNTSAGMLSVVAPAASRHTSTRPPTFCTTPLPTAPVARSSCRTWQGSAGPLASAFTPAVPTEAVSTCAPPK
jgi:hypothetical protein